MAWVWPAGLAVLALAGASGAGATERSAPGDGAGATEAVDAEMLRDLELLASPDYARAHEVARRMTFFERLRMLESERARESGPAPAPARALEPAGGSR
jgi:hypothetical protein